MLTDTTYHTARRCLATVLLSVALLGVCGCVVPQPRGQGRMSYRREARTGAGYYLYVPADYVASEGRRAPDRKFPLVVSFHGMRPWDSSGAQIMEWQQEADRYGYVVIAPDTRVSDMLGELPVRRVSGSVRADERDVLAVMDEVTTNLDVDPNHVLSTSWSMGGYLAHYMLNRHPDRFSCLAVRQSNFSAAILDPARVPDYRDHRVAVFWTQNDFAICRSESKKAIQWYTGHGFDITHGIIERLGHERTPEIAAAFFAMSCGAEPKSLPDSLARRIRMKSGNAAERLAFVTAGDAPAQPVQTPDSPIEIHSASAATAAERTEPPATPDGLDTADDDRPERVVAARTPDRPMPLPRSAPSRMSAETRRGPRPLATRPLPATVEPTPVPAARRTPRPASAPRAAARRQEGTAAVASVRLSAYIGISPMRVSYTVQMPPDLLEGADVLWTDNGEPISQGISGQRSLVAPGQHRIEVRVITRDDREYRASKTVTVLDRLTFDDDGRD